MVGHNIKRSQVASLFEVNSTPFPQSAGKLYSEAVDGVGNWPFLFPKVGGLVVDDANEVEP
jgi:hypothetical protein